MFLEVLPEIGRGDYLLIAEGSESDWKVLTPVNLSKPVSNLVLAFTKGVLSVSAVCSRIHCCGSVRYGRCFENADWSRLG